MKVMASTKRRQHAEHKTTRATGKIWAVGMNNNYFSLGEARLAIQCGPTPMNYVVHVIPVSAELFLGTTLHGEVCPGEWVYHFIDPGLIGAIRLRPSPPLQHTQTARGPFGCASLSLRRLDLRITPL